MTEDAQAWEAQKARWQSEAAEHPRGQPLTLAGLQQKEAQEREDARQLKEAREADRRREQARRLAETRRRAEIRELERQQWRRIEEQRGRVSAPWPVRVANGRRGSSMPPPGTRGPAYDARIWQAQVEARERQVNRQNEYNAGMGFYR
jgi:hypothetical protein